MLIYFIDSLSINSKLAFSASSNSSRKSRFLVPGTQFVLLFAFGFEFANSNASHLDTILFFFGPVPESSISASSKILVYFFLLAIASYQEAGCAFCAPGLGLASKAANEFLKSALFAGYLFSSFFTGSFLTSFLSAAPVNLIS